MNMKKFINKFEDADKKERVKILTDEMDTVIKYVLSKNYENDQYASQFNTLVLSKKFVKALKKYVKDNDVNPKLVLIITEAFTRINSDTDKEIVETLTEIVRSILNPRTKKLMKKTGLPETVATNLLIDCPEEIKSSDKFSIFLWATRRLVNKLYHINKVIANEENAKVLQDKVTDIDVLIRIFDIILGEDQINKVWSYLLLEKADHGTSLQHPEQKAMWEALTNVALANIESMQKKKEIAAYLTNNYISVRRKQNDIDNGVNRRVDLTSIDKEVFPKIAKAVAYLIDDNDSNAKYLK